MENQLFTESGKSYWDETGVYQEQYDKLYKDLVPSSGSAKTLNGELIRAISRILHEYLNNGNINACETEMETEEYTCCSCSGAGEFEGDEICDEETGEPTGEYEMEECMDCCGSGYEEEEVEGESTVSDFYWKFLKLIGENVNDIDKELNEIEENITANLYSNHEIQFSDENRMKYERLADKVIFYVLNNEDKELPENYIQD